MTIVSTELCHPWNYPFHLFMFFHQNGMAQIQNQTKRGNGEFKEIQSKFRQHKFTNFECQFFKYRQPHVPKCNHRQVNNFIDSSHGNYTSFVIIVHSCSDVVFRKLVILQQKNMITY